MPYGFQIYLWNVKAGGKWSLICPNECQTLSEVYGQEFKNLYESLEEQGLFVRQVDARTLWDAILTSQIETGHTIPSL